MYPYFNFYLKATLPVQIAINKFESLSSQNNTNKPIISPHGTSPRNITKLNSISTNEYSNNSPERLVL